MNLCSPTRSSWFNELDASVLLASELSRNNLEVITCSIPNAGNVDFKTDPIGSNTVVRYYFGTFCTTICPLVHLIAQLCTVRVHWLCKLKRLHDEHWTSVQYAIQAFCLDLSNAFLCHVFDQRWQIYWEGGWLPHIWKTSSDFRSVPQKRGIQGHVQTWCDA